MIKLDNLVKEGIIIKHGGLFDRTKCFAPDILKLSDDSYRIYYVGTNCQPNERSGYSLLVAESKTGREFKKKGKLIFKLDNSGNYKYYSPEIVKHNDYFLLYYSLGINGKYSIRSVISEDGLSFSQEDRVDINLPGLVTIHTLKIVRDKNVFHCYFTGSDNLKKICSRLAPKCDFSSDFKIYYCYSKDLTNFSKPKEIKLDLPKIINFYGHNIYLNNGIIYLIFSAFDGFVNKLFFSYSKDMLNFIKPYVILEPDIKQGEIGLYSCSFLPIDKRKFRLYYGARYFNNKWDILSATFKLTVC